MRYPASEKLEIIRLVEQSDLSVRLTLLRLGIRKSTFYGWLKRYHECGVDGLEDRKPSPGLVWNKLPEDQQAAIIELALERPELSPRELAVAYTDEQSSFVSESTVYRLLKVHDLITSPAYILMEAADKFQHPTSRVNEMWQTDFTYCAPILRRYLLLILTKLEHVWNAFWSLVVMNRMPTFCYEKV
ncbi:Transposase [Nitrosomonas aestuarii]|uniref:Transposase n=1 Tax=Nitrosomonas aestuarii TaxID=52441 RepID=A0A1I4HJS4_9PROT|nr:Transposase [Nitrosomonas aestuarii]